MKIWIDAQFSPAIATEKMKEILYTTLNKAKDLLEEGEAIVEISDKIL